MVRGSHPIRLNVAKMSHVRLDNPLPLCNPARTCRRVSEGLLSGVSEAEHREVSGAGLGTTRLLTPPIHPRVATGVVLPALRLITWAGRGDAIRSA